MEENSRSYRPITQKRENQGRQKLTDSTSMVYCIKSTGSDRPPHHIRFPLLYDLNIA